MVVWAVPVGGPSQEALFSIGFAFFFSLFLSRSLAILGPHFGQIIASKTSQEDFHNVYLSSLFPLLLVP